MRQSTSWALCLSTVTLTPPDLRDGQLSDTLDYGRAGLADPLANLYRVRALLRETAGRP